MRQALPCPPPPTRTNHQIELNEGFTNERARGISHLHHKPPEVCAWTKMFIYDIIYAGLEIALSKTYSNLVLKTIMPFEIEDMIKDFENGTRLSNINVH